MTARASSPPGPSVVFLYAPPAGVQSASGVTRSSSPEFVTSATARSRPPAEPGISGLHRKRPALSVEAVATATRSPDGAANARSRAVFPATRTAIAPSIPERPESGRSAKRTGIGSPARARTAEARGSDQSSRGSPDDSGLHVAPGLLVARVRLEQILDDPVLQIRRLRVARVDGGLRFGQRPIEPRVPGDERREPVVRGRGRGRVAGRACQLQEAEEEEQIRGRLRQRRLEIRSGAALVLGTPRAQDAHGGPAGCDVPGRGRGRPFVRLRGAGGIAGELFPRRLEREHPRIAGREPERLGQKRLRRLEVARAHRGDRAVGPAERIRRRQAPHLGESARRLGEVVLLEGGEPDVAVGLKRPDVGRRTETRRGETRRRARGGRSRKTGNTTPFRPMALRNAS